MIINKLPNNQEYQRFLNDILSKIALDRLRECHTNFKFGRTDIWIRNFDPSVIAQEMSSVQPMGECAGSIFNIRYIHPKWYVRLYRKIKRFFR